jgi:hypothetical protein
MAGLILESATRKDGSTIARTSTSKPQLGPDSRSDGGRRETAVPRTCRVRRGETSTTETTDTAETAGSATVRATGCLSCGCVDPCFFGPPGSSDRGTGERRVDRRTGELLLVLGEVWRGVTL